MTESVGHIPTNVVLYARAPSNAELLLFDNFVVTPLSHNIEAPIPFVPLGTHRLYGINDENRAMIEFLGEHGVVLDIRPGEEFPLVWPNARETPTPEPDTLEQMEEFAAIRVTRPTADTMTALPENIAVLTVRLWALILQRMSNDNQFQSSEYFIPVYDQMAPVLNPTATASPVVSVLLRAIPVPAHNVPIEAILDFRNDKDAMDALVELRLWANDIAASELSLKEIEQKLQELIYVHRRHMKLHKLETRRTAIRTLMRLPLEIAEQVPRLRFSKIFDEICKIRVGRLDFLKAEMASEGRAVAYITRIAEEFGKEHCRPTSAFSPTRFARG